MRFLRRLWTRLRYGYWPVRLKRMDLSKTFVPDAEWLCPRCGHIDCPGPASCLSEGE